MGRICNAGRRPVYFGVEIWKNCFWYPHIQKVIEMRKALTGKMDVILRGTHLDNGMNLCILVNAIVPKGYAGEAWEGNAELVEKLEVV